MTQDEQDRLARAEEQERRLAARIARLEEELALCLRWVRLDAARRGRASGRGQAVDAALVDPTPEDDEG